jgi:hypothetical protein
LRTLPILVMLCACGEPNRDFLSGHAAGGATTLFLNYEPVMIDGGSEDATKNHSKLVMAKTQFAGYRRIDPQRSAKLAALTEEITSLLSRYNIEVTDVRPAKGPYHMIVFTDDTGAGVACPGCISLGPSFCDQSKAPGSAVAFVFGGVFQGDEMPPHMATSQAISMLGAFVAIPTSVKAKDCMCYNETLCIDAQMTMSGQCEVGPIGTPVSTTQACPTTLTTMDEDYQFGLAFGAVY